MVARLVVARLCCALALVAMVSCGNNARAPVEDRTARTPPSPPPTHTRAAPQYRVQRGDTLYSIAFRYGLDFRKVAAANQIPAPYTIYPGQQLTLKEGALRPAAAKPPPSPSTPKYPAAPPVATPPKKVVAKPVPSTSTAAASKQAVYTGAAVKTWRWPTAGKVTRRYSSSVHKGIDIGGNRGDAIVAVAPGKVVYAGTGIVGFGELLILKHNDLYLSAYGHNDRLLVAEGDVVSAGQAIAKKGSTGTDTVKLHFEIRKEGKPIDPQRVLPRR